MKTPIIGYAIAVVAGIIVLGFGCTDCSKQIPPSPGPVPVPSPFDASILDSGKEAGSPFDGPGTPCQKMCANLQVLGCAEATRHGIGVCVTTCEHVVMTGFVALDVKCLAEAETVYAAKICGIKCPIK